MFKAVVQDARIWKNLLTAISTLIEEADFNATNEGLKLRLMDSVSRGNGGLRMA